MDIIAAHQQGLIEQLDHEVSALAGRRGDHGQRAVVLHHLYHHSRGEHHWALTEARREARIAGALIALERRIGRWGWTAAARSEARAGLDMLGQALGEHARDRTAAAYRAYRLSATAALRGEAGLRVPVTLLEMLDNCHAARRAGASMTDKARRVLAEESEAAAAGDSGALDAARAAIDATRLGGAARKLVGPEAMARADRVADRRGAAWAEARLRRDKALPEAFRANPAQHFYALLHALGERRRSHWRAEADGELDAVALAA